MLHDPAQPEQLLKRKTNTKGTLEQIFIETVKKVWWERDRHLKELKALHFKNMGSEDKAPVMSPGPLMFPTAQQLRTHPALHTWLSPLIWGYNDAPCMPTLDGMDKTKAETTTGLGFSTRLMGLRSSTKQPVFSSVFATDLSYGQTCSLWRWLSTPPPAV